MGEKVASAIVEDLERSNWRFEQGPAPEGHGPNIMRMGAKCPHHARAAARGALRRGRAVELTYAGGGSARFGIHRFGFCHCDASLDAAV
jgi:hypothetical protein